MAHQAQQIANAARLLVSPETDASTRAKASSFLESWTQSVEAWDLYGPWLASFVSSSASTSHYSYNNHSDPTEAGVQLLCLQLLQAKIRRELPRQVDRTATVSQNDSNPSLEAIRSALSQLILHTQPPPIQANDRNQTYNNTMLSVLQSACICLTALEVRMGNLANYCTHLLSSCARSSPQTTATSRDTLTSHTALRLLSEIPSAALDACANSDTSQVTAKLQPFWDGVWPVLSHHLAQRDTCTLAAQALDRWVDACHVSLTQLYTTTAEGQPAQPHQAILPLLVQLLSQSDYASDQATLLSSVSKALTTALTQPADACTPSRNAAVEGLVQATHVHGFLGRPLLTATAAGWDDASHALVTLLCTMLTEDIDDIIQLPADGLLHLLLAIQRTHPQIRIKSLVLEAWLTVQDIPTMERHENWKTPLSLQITDTLLEALSYPTTFVNWEEEINMEQSDFEDYRRLAPDVLVGCYNMLRVDFLHRLCQPIMAWNISSSVSAASSSISWAPVEAAFFAFTAIAREVCQRIKTTIGGTRIMQDKEATIHMIQQVAEAACRPAPPVLTVTICQYLGAYAAAWTALSDSSVIRILDYLLLCFEQSVSAQDAAARAIKSILTVSCAQLAQGANPSFLNALQAFFSIALVSNNEHAMTTIGEGCVRILVQVPDVAAREQSLLGLVQALTRRGNEALAIVPSDGSPLSEQAFAAMGSLLTYLRVLCVMIRFAENTTSGGCTYLLASALSQYGWPFLEATSQRMVYYTQILDGVLGVQEQLLRSAPDILAHQFSSTLQNCVSVFEQSKNPSTLPYFGSAVEAYGAKGEGGLFENLLNHISKVFFAFIATEKPPNECTDLVEGYFELCQRYLLFCPGALVRCEVLPTIVSCALDCLTACKGERNSTRATLNFLEKVVGWRRLPISASAKQDLYSGSQRLDEQIALHGRRLVQLCLDILIGGPRPLWPACGDCIFAVVVATIAWPVPEASDSSVARQWLEGASLNVSLDAKSASSLHAYRQAVEELLMMAQKGPTLKAKAKMLLSDFSQAINGQQVIEILSS